MNPSQLFVIVVIVILLTLVVRRVLRLDLAALIMALLMGLGQFFGLGVLGPENTPSAAREAISGLSQPVTQTLIGLFIITHTLDRLGVTRWLAQRLLALGGKSERRLLILFSATAAGLSLFMNNIAVGALLLPSAIDASRRSGTKPSKLLIPVAYGTLLGGIATYFTTANILISDLLTTAVPPQEPLGILDFTPVGGLMALAGIAYLAIFAPRLLPDRTPFAEQMLLRPTGSELQAAYQLHERIWQAYVQPNSTLIGRTLIQSSLGEQLGVTVVAVLKGRRMLLATSFDVMLQAGDTLLVVGNEEQIMRLEERGLQIRRDLTFRHLSALSLLLVEVLPVPHSSVEGKTLKEINFRRQYGFTAVALWRDGHGYYNNLGDFKLEAGDSFLMVGGQPLLKRLRYSPDFIALEPDTSDIPMQRRQVTQALVIALGAVIASLAGIPVYLAMLGGSVCMILSGFLTMEEAYRSVEWQTIFLIAGMYTLSLAMVQTSLATEIGDNIVKAVTPFGALGLIAGCYLLAAGLTQVMGSQVTALVVGPIAISAALNLGTNPQAVAIATAIGCSASFLTPLAHPINLLVMAPGNYQFGDFFRLGWGLMLVSFVMLLIGMELFWL